MPRQTRRIRPANNTARLSTSTSSEGCLDFAIVDLVAGARANVEHCVEEQPGSPLDLFENPEAAERIAAACAGPGYIYGGFPAWLLSVGPSARSSG